MAQPLASAQPPGASRDAVRIRDAVVLVPRGKRILGPVSLRVGPDEHWVILGPNGSGKTTLLTLAGALRHPSSGTVEVLGERLGRVDVRELRARIGYVGHSISEALRTGLSVRDVVLTGKRSTLVTWWQGFDDADRAEADALLERFGCAHLADQSLERCSQGERQRVLLARALFGRRELLLLDEPAAGLDLPARELLLAALESARGVSESPSILVTHHVEEIPRTTTHAALLREGELVASGPVDVALTDATLTTCFDLPLSVARPDGRWSAHADTQRSHG